ncbi:O-antigen ligase [Pacificibacter maritimus]|uniref:O-antigen ligase n=1 Tax=Pacificibacter maritimus TaxID=762213 RepID=A0A3N4UMI6_9RHOB|nr:O-antigen ligase family protein [Pacificibacter maritimus]RPE71866.1 O-antigen ligase [Pacificibacter maritimus]
MNNVVFVLLFGFILASVSIKSNQITFLIAFSAAALFLVLCALTRIKTGLLGIPFLVALTLVWIALTAIWAPSFVETSIKVLRASCVVIAIFCGVSLLGVQRVMRNLPALVFTMIVAQYIAIFFFSFGVHAEHEVYLRGAWRGFMAHKNEAGALGAVAVLVFAREIFLRPSLFMLLGLTLSSIFLLQTNSETSFVLVFLGLFTLFAFNSFRLSRLWRYLLTLTALASIIVIFIIVVGSSISETIFGDPYGFTGRVGLWKAAIYYWELHPIIGNGFRSVFGNPNVNLFSIAQTPYTVLAPHPHNGYVDMLSGTGLVGFLLATFAFLVGPIYRALKISNITAKTPVPLCTAIIVFSAARAFFEGSILQYDNAAWVLWLLALAIFFQYFSDIKKGSNDDS